MVSEELSDEHRLDRIARELKDIRTMLTKVIFYIHEGEAEVPEGIRRFSMYMHDIHDIAYMYEERGHQVPQYIISELERGDDRLRQLLEKLHTDGGAFERVRREMAEDPNNRWDHTRQLTKGNSNETGTS